MKPAVKTLMVTMMFTRIPFLIQNARTEAFGEMAKAKASLSKSLINKSKTSKSNTKIACKGKAA